MNRFVSLLLLACALIIINSCTKEYSRESFTNIPAQGSLLDDSGNCLPSNVYGTFYTGVTPGSDTAYVQVEVNVTQTGSYSIITQPLNGLTFFDSGYFTTTGINTIHLKPIGTPIIITTSTFDFTFDSSTCSFSVSVLDSTGLGLGNPPDTTGTTTSPGTWRFATDSGGNFSGTIQYAHLYPDTLLDGSVNGYILSIYGFTSTGDSVMGLDILYPTNTITTGTFSSLDYNNDSSKTTTFAFCPSNGADCFYFAEGISDDPSVKVNINVTSYNSTTQNIQGTFSGIAVSGGDFNGSGGPPTKTIQILNGSFNATVQ